MRVFAGPNGSGKSTMFNEIARQFDLGIYINPDEIEKKLKTEQAVDLSLFSLTDLSANDFSDFIDSHTLLEKAEKEGHTIDLKYDPDQNLLINLSGEKPSYEAALIADYLRIKLIERGKKLSFESVMSHSSKLEVFDLAAKHGYKVYLYFICTESPDINIDRVKQRVLEGGHHVDDDKIEKRYYLTLNLLKDAVRKTYRSFLWDNSGTESELILEVEGGSNITMITDNHTPHWCEQYLLAGSQPSRDQ